MSNLTRRLEKLVKPAILVGLVIMALSLGFCQEAKADTSIEVGAAVASGEYTDGQYLAFTERFDKYAVTFGYITQQNIVPRSGRLYKADPNLFLQVMREVQVYKKFYAGIGVAYFNKTNRALGSKTNAGLSLYYRASDRLWFQYRHFSNAGTASPNMGQDLIGFTYVY